MQIPQTPPTSVKLPHSSCKLSLVRTTITGGGNDDSSSPLAAMRNGCLGGDHTSPFLSWAPKMGESQLSGCSWKRYGWHRVSFRAGSCWYGDKEETPVVWRDLPYEGYLLETGLCRLEGRSKPRGWLSSSDGYTGTAQEKCGNAAQPCLQHTAESQGSAGSSSLGHYVMEGPGAGRKAGKQVNYARKLGQSGSRDIIEYRYFFSS